MMGSGFGVKDKMDALQHVHQLCVRGFRWYLFNVTSQVLEPGGDDGFVSLTPFPRDPK